MKKHLLYTSHYENSLAEIKAAGGRVTHKFSNHVFVAHLPASATGSKLNHSSLEPLSDLDDVSSLLVSAWKELEANSQPAEAMEFSLDDGIIPVVEDSSQLHTMMHEGRKIIAAHAGPPSPFTEQMKGTVAAGIVIVSGPKNKNLNFSTTEEVTVTQQFMKACKFLSDKGGESADLTFVYDIQRINISAAPQNTCSSIEKCEAVYRDPALKKMGYGSGIDGVLDYVTAVINRTDGAKWGFAAFISKYPFPGNNGAYADGARLCLKYNFPWTNGDFSAMLVANICILFGASWEIEGCTCAPSGINDVSNNNCITCFITTGFFDQPCILRNYQMELCPWTMGQIGWYKTSVSGNPALGSSITGDGLKPLIAYRDGSSQVSLMMRFDYGWAYLNIGFLSGARLASGDPKVTVVGGPLLPVIYRDEFNFLCNIRLKGSTWVFEDICGLSGNSPKCVGNPSILAYDVRGLHVIYRTEDGNVIALYFDGSGWKRWINLTELLNAWPAKGDPHINSFGDIFFDILFLTISNRIGYIRWTGTEWEWADLIAVTPGCPLASGNPTGIQYGISFHAIYRDVNGDISDITWDGTKWTYLNLNQLATNAKKPSGDPSVSLYMNDLYIVYRDTDQHVSTIYYSAANQNWLYKDLTNSVSGAAPINGDPAITSFANQLNVVYRNKNNQISDIKFADQKWNYQRFNV